MKAMIAAATACSALALAATASTASAEPRGHAYGYWAGRLCDHVGPTTGGLAYWESRGYEDRDECIEIEGASLRAGEWDPDELDDTLYPI